MNWIETKNKLPDIDKEVLCCLKDSTRKIDDMFFVGGISDNSKWYIYCSDGVAEPEDNRYFISHWCEIVPPEDNDAKYLNFHQLLCPNKTQSTTVYLSKQLDKYRNIKSQWF